MSAALPPVYCIPGLSNDRRVFRRLALNWPDVRLTDWIEPVDVTEHISDYTQRFLQHWKIEEEAVLIGFSLGGLVAVEAARLQPNRKIILIGSIKAVAERPPALDLAALFPMHQLLPEFLAKYAFLPVVPFFGSPAHGMQPVFRDMWQQTSSRMMRWGVNQLLSWNNQWLPAQVLHIHGDQDRIFPIRYIQNASVIAGGEHVMIVNQAEEISRQIDHWLTNAYNVPVA